MSAHAAIAAVLEHLSDSQIDGLAAACHTAAAPPSSLNAVVAGATPGARQTVAELLSAWRGTPGLTGPGVSLALQTGLAGRRLADARRSRAVWTGPQAVGEQRLTASTLHGLLSAATERVLLVSFAAYTLKQVGDDLAAAVERGCVVDVIFETSEDSASYDGPSTPFGAIAGIRRWRWPGDQRPPHAALHAKLLVIDGRRALIGSANLTKRALADNLEAGLLVRDPEVAASLEQHVRGLMNGGAFVRSDVA